MQKKRVFSAFLALCLTLTLLPAYALAAEDSFSDMPEDYSTTALNAAVSNGLLKGTEGKILPDDSLTRAQMAAIIVRAFGATETTDLTGYTDVASGAWYYAELSSAVKMKALQGDGTTMRPDAPITRQEAFAILARALKLTEGTSADLAAYTDAGSVASWAIGSTAAMVKAGYVHGADGKLNPTANITRKDFAVLMDNIVKTYVNTADVVTSVAAGNVMVNVPGATLKDLTVTGNLIVGDGVGDGDLTLENVKVTGAMIVRGGGINSIIIKGTSSVGQIVVSKADGNVRIHVEDGANVDVIYVADGKDDVIVEGKVDKLEVAASDVPVVVKNAEIAEVVVSADQANVTIDQNSTVKTITASGAEPTLTVAGKVETLTATASATGAQIEVVKGAKVTTANVAAAGAAISGEGTVTNANVSGNNVRVDTKGTKVTAAESTTGVTVNGKEIKGGETVTSGSTSSSGGSSSGGDSTVAVTGVTVTSDANTVVVGKTLQMKATVSPDNATDKSVTWSVSDITVATIDSSGVLTAVASGTVTVTATTSNGKIGTVSITVTDALTLAKENAETLLGNVAAAKEALETEQANASRALSDLEAASAWLTQQGEEAGLITNYNDLVMKVKEANAELSSQLALVTENIEKLDGISSSITQAQGYDDAGAINAAVSQATEGLEDVTLATNNLKAAVGQANEAIEAVNSAKTVAVTGVTVTSNATTVVVGDTLRLTATVSPADATDKSVTWIVSDTAVAKIDSSTGVLTAVASGAVTVTATTSNGKSDTVSITVITALQKAQNDVTVAQAAVSAAEEALEAKQGVAGQALEAVEAAKATLAQAKEQAEAATDAEAAEAAEAVESAEAGLAQANEALEAANGAVAQAREALEAAQATLAQAQEALEALQQPIPAE